MGNIEVGRYDHPDSVKYKGWVKSADEGWIMFIRLDGTPQFFFKEDLETGASE